MLSVLKAMTWMLMLATFSSSSLTGQQKGQWPLGQSGLNAGMIPNAGVTYANLTINYSASKLNDSNGNSLPGINGNYSFWVDENFLYYVPRRKFLGGYFMPYVTLSYATGEVVANITGTNLSTAGGGSGFADIYAQPLNLGWHFGKRVDFNAGYAFFAPAGRYTAGATDNVGSGYWGNNVTSGTTLYITKNQGTTANLFTDWEIHGEKTVAGTLSNQFSKITPGQAFTTEWGFGQILPLKKDLSQLAQVGLVGYDQWQVTSNGGNYLVAGFPVAASKAPYYSVHGMGLQASYLVPGKNVMALFKYYDEYRALARPKGRTFAFGFLWTFKIPKTQAPKT